MQDMEPATLCEALGKLMDPFGEFEVRADISRYGFAFTDKPLCFDQIYVVGWIVRQPEGGPVFESPDQHAHSVHGSKSFGAGDPVQSLRACPGEAFFEQRLRPGRMVFALEQIEEGSPALVVFVVAAVIENGKTAYGTCPLVGQEELSLRMFIKREALQIQPDPFVSL